MPYFWAKLGMQLTITYRPILGFRYTGVGVSVSQSVVVPAKSYPPLSHGSHSFDVLV